MGNKVLKLKKNNTVLVGIDFQERLMPAMYGKEELETTAVKLVKGCRILGVPAIVTQQYTKGLGPTIPSIEKALTEPAGEEVAVFDLYPVEKTSFSAMGEPIFVENMKKLGRSTVVIAGIEAHVCVQQTVIDLLESGYNVFVAADCISSRSKYDKEFSLGRMEHAGAVVTTCESILFELLGGAKEAGFKQISALVK